MTTAHTITHQIAAPLEVIPADLGLRAQNIVTAINNLPITDAETFKAGNRLLTEAHTTLKELEKVEDRLVKPINDLKRSIKEVLNGVSAPLDQAKRSMQAAVTAYDRAEREKAEKIRREAEEKARQEREAAEKERARLQAEADAKAKADAEELAAITGTVVKPEAVKVELPKPAPTPVIPAAPVLPKAAAQIVKVPELVITDPAALAAWLCAQGRADLIEFKKREVKAMLDAGSPVAGAVIEMREQTRMAGGRA